MNKDTIKYFTGFVKNYFSRCGVSRSTMDKNAYCECNVKYHLNDRDWIHRYVFNRIYTELSYENPVIGEIHCFVTTDTFEMIFQDYKNKVIDKYTYAYLKTLSKDALTKQKEGNRYLFVCDNITHILKTELGLNKDDILKRLNENKENISNIINEIIFQANTSEKTI